MDEFDVDCDAVVHVLAPPRCSGGIVDTRSRIGIFGSEKHVERLTIGERACGTGPFWQLP